MIAWLILGIALLVTTVGLWLVVLNFRTPLPPGVSSVLSDAALILAFLPYAVVGALIVSRQPANRIGWLFLVSGLLMGVGLTAFEYAIYGDLTNPGSLPGTSWALRTSQWVSFIPFLTYAFLFLLFPDGRLPSRRWRPVAILAVLSIGWLEANSIAPGVIPLWPARELTVVAMLLCASAPVVRYRRSESDERHQIKWFAFAALPAVALLLPGLFVNVPDAGFVPFVVVTGAVPIAAAIGIFKYRLYDIDVIIDKTLVYGGLAAFITAVYVVVVVVVGAFIGATEVPRRCCRWWRPRSSPWRSSRRDCVLRASRGASSTEIWQRRTRPSPRSPSASLRRSRSTMCCRAWQGSLPKAPPLPELKYGSAWDRSFGNLHPGRRPMDRGLRRCHSTMAAM